MSLIPNLIIGVGILAIIIKFFGHQIVDAIRVMWMQSNRIKDKMFPNQTKSQEDKNGETER